MTSPFPESPGDRSVRPWLAMLFASMAVVPAEFCLGAHVDKIVRFIPKSDLDRARLIREARAIYERIFPPAAVSEPRDAKE